MRAGSAGVDAGETAFEQPLGVGGTPAAQAFLGERRPVLDRIGLLGALRQLAQVTLGVDHRADVAHRTAGGAAVTEVRDRSR